MFSSRTKKYIQVGGLDETLKVAYNDVDFNLKLLDAGYYNLFIPQVELIHYESKSRGLDSTSESINNSWQRIIICIRSGLSILNVIHITIKI